jgi:hypothetical protein
LRYKRRYGIQKKILITAFTPSKIFFDGYKKGLQIIFIDDRGHKFISKLKDSKDCGGY